MLVRKALALGYAAADYRTRLGERTVAWYRGPLLPVAMQPNPQPPFRDAEAALVYDPDTGMFDVSFGVAWQTGRLLALADREIATALAAWVRRSRRALVRALGRDRLRRTHPVVATSPATAAAQARTLMAAELAPGAGAWGPPVDLSGLLGQVGRLPGLVAPDDLPGVLSGPGTPASALLAAVRSRGPYAAARKGRPAGRAAALRAGPRPLPAHGPPSAASPPNSGPWSRIRAVPAPCCAASRCRPWSVNGSPGSPCCTPSRSLRWFPTPGAAAGVDPVRLPRPQLDQCAA